MPEVSSAAQFGNRLVIRGMATGGCLLALVLLLTAEVSAQSPPRSANELSNANTSALGEQARAQYQFGHRQLREDNLGGALESFSQVIEQHPDFAEAYLSRALVYRRLEKVAPNVEERDRAALGYINDERRVIKSENRQWLAKELEEVFTVRTIALTAIFFTFWLAIVVLFWQEGYPLVFGVATFLITNLLMLAVPDGWLRYCLFAAGITVHAFTAYSKFHSKPRPNRSLEDSPLEASLRDVRRAAVTSDPDAFEPETKVCPECSRQVGQQTRVCPRCEFRF